LYPAVHSTGFSLEDDNIWKTLKQQACQTQAGGRHGGARN
jgi:hypothetical protein